MTISPEQQALVETLVTPAKAWMDTSQISDIIHNGVDSSMGAVPPLMRVLDEVAKIHPFINGTVSFPKTSTMLMVLLSV